MTFGKDLHTLFTIEYLERRVQERDREREREREREGEKREGGRKERDILKTHKVLYVSIF